MNSIRDKCIEYLQNEDIRKDVKDIMKAVGNIVYNEAYIYVWILCFYNVFLIFIILANLALLLQVLAKNSSVTTIVTDI